jgi:hypothetical protein
LRCALDDGSLALLVGFDVVAIVGSLPAWATDRWFRPPSSSIVGIDSLVLVDGGVDASCACEHCGQLVLLKSIDGLVSC